MAAITPNFTDWTEKVTGTFRFSSNYQTIMQFRVKDIYGNYSDIVEKTFAIDKVAPTIIDPNQIWSNNTYGYDNYNLLSWSNDLVNDKYDGFVGYKVINTTTNFY